MQDDKRPETPVTIGWLRNNFAMVAAIVGALLYMGMGYAQVLTQLEALKAANIQDQTRLSEMQNIPYRVGQTEAAIDKTNERIDALSNNIISQMDLIRRDVNRLTTTVEVLSSRVGVLTGDIDAPIQRRSRPGPSETAATPG